MHDLKYIRKDTDEFRRRLERRGEGASLDRLILLDDKKLRLTASLDEMRSRRNSVSKEIGLLRRESGDTAGLEDEMRRLGADLKAGAARERELDLEIHEILLDIPNLPDDSTPDGLTEADNVEERRYGEMPAFDFEPLDHIDLGNRLGIFDFPRGGKIAGSGFPVWSGPGARLERALINFMLDMQTREHGYREMLTPFVASRESMIGSGQIPHLEDDMYHCERDDLFLIPTSEVTLINLHRGEILRESDLPLKYAAYSPCFRREAGAYGKATRGFLRVHQFNKVELVRFEHPANAEAAWEEMIGHAEEVLKRLELHYRVVRLCAGDMGFNAAACVDLEVWSPAGKGNWLEASSISNCGDFQARRTGIRFRPAGGGKPRFPHILNGSGVATSRLMAALVETHQTVEGSLSIPPALRPYMDGQTVITAGDRGGSR